METMVKADPEHVLASAEGFFKKDWTRGREIKRRAPHVLEVEMIRGWSNQPLWWMLNITLTLLTLGSWLPIGFIWGLWRAEKTEDLVRVSAYPEGTRSRVDVESTSDEWRADVEEWLRRTLT